MSSSHRTQTTFQRFVESEAAGGLVLMASAALGLAAANSPLAESYTDLLHARVAGLDVLHWINDGLMALFFLLVGLEIKREMVEGQLDTWPRRALPLIAAFGGMLVPALIFMAVNARHQENWRGWAVPTATDIAFALGVLSLLGSRVPSSLLFLGKQGGVLASVYLAKQARVGALPAGASWRQIYGVAILCGIGFTMSLFIGLLAFSDPEKEAVLKLAVLVGSLLSALAGALVLLTVDRSKSKTAS